MVENLAEDIIKEGVDTLYSNLGTIKTIKFLQMLSLGKGDSVKEIEQKTEQMSKEDVIQLIAQAKKTRPELWKKVGLL